MQKILSDLRASFVLRFTSLDSFVLFLLSGLGCVCVFSCPALVPGTLSIAFALALLINFPLFVFSGKDKQETRNESNSNRHVLKTPATAAVTVACTR